MFTSDDSTFYRKYLRDNDRIELSKLAWRYTLESVDSAVQDISEEKDAEKRLESLMTVHRIWNHGKIVYEPSIVNGMLSRTYRAFRQGNVSNIHA